MAQPRLTNAVVSFTLANVPGVASGMGVILTVWNGRPNSVDITVNIANPGTVYTLDQFGLRCLWVHSRNDRIQGDRRAGLHG